MDDLIRHPLAHARTERGWSQPELARRIRRAALRRGLRSGVDRQRVWSWENSRAVPDADSQMLLADVFEVEPSLVPALGWPNWLPGRDTALPLGPYSSVPALREALRAVDRRTFLTYSTAALTGLAHQWATTEPRSPAEALTGRQVDGELVDLLEATGRKLTGLVTAQRRHTSTLLDAHLATVADLIDARNYTEPVGRRLHVLAARTASTIGWHRFDQGHHAAAARHWHGALHSAHASGDRDLGAGILSDFAYQATWLHDPKTAADLLDHARTRTRHPTARSLLHLRLARAQAALGDGAACRTSLTHAETQLQRACGDPAPAWCTWMQPADLLVDSGQCLLDLGHPERAHHLIGEGITLLPTSRDKTRAVFLAHEARGYLTAGEADRAAAAATEAFRLGHAIGAPRCIHLVTQMTPDFKRHAGAEGVDELLHHARAV
ncbi:helix-turn-helix transcriptional regulator [Streptomyces sp. 4F14]|uniref:helix-turn-helix transcriptional regulator n=1 Tax=Streptomyces sp. 4F14 TaxID=3394380 RepID=UPI003A83BBDD